MGTLKTIILVIFFLDSVLLVIAVLLQSGRGGGLAGALGGISGADSALGVRAASQIEKATGLMAVIFLACALALGFISGSSSGGAGDTKIGGRGTSIPAMRSPTSAPAGEPPAPAAEPPSAPEAAK